MDKWAGSICELDIMYQLEQVHFLLDEMVMNGYIVVSLSFVPFLDVLFRASGHSHLFASRCGSPQETSKGNILRPLDLMERESRKDEGMFR